MSTELRDAALERRVNSPLHVVVVDDSDDNAELLAELIRRLGHRVRLAHDGESALGLFEQELPDVVFLDLGLPQMDGYEVATAIRARFGRAVQLVALTGFSGKQDRRRAHETGFDGFLVKPHQPTQIEELLTSYQRLAIPQDAQGP